MRPFGFVAAKGYGESRAQFFKECRARASLDPHDDVTTIQKPARTRATCASAIGERKSGIETSALKAASA